MRTIKELIDEDDIESIQMWAKNTPNKTINEHSIEVKIHSDEIPFTMTPLHYAVATKKIKISLILLSMGADPLIVEKMGNIPLDSECSISVEKFSENRKKPLTRLPMATPLADHLMLSTTLRDCLKNKPANPFIPSEYMDLDHARGFPTRYSAASLAVRLGLNDVVEAMLSREQLGKKLGHTGHC